MEEDIENHLPTVMFRGTPCTNAQGFFLSKTTKEKNHFQNYVN